jgi:uncharacterized protein DUF4440
MALRPQAAMLLLAALAGAPMWAHEPKPQPTPQPPTMRAEPAGSPAAAVESFHRALAAGDRDRALSLLDPQVLIFESGGAETSRDEYAAHHLAADREFVRAVKSELVDRLRRVQGQWLIVHVHWSSHARKSGD